MKAKLACLEGKVCSYFCLQWVGAAGLWYQGPEKDLTWWEESQVIKMKAKLACLEGKVCSYFCLQWVGAAGLWYQGPEKD